jgi:hypothetical protein
VLDEECSFGRYNGVKALGDFLRSQASLKKLILRRNHLHTEAFKFIAEALQMDETLEVLDIAGERDKTRLSVYHQAMLYVHMHQDTTVPFECLATPAAKRSPMPCGILCPQRTSSAGARRGPRR